MIGYYEIDCAIAKSGPQPLVVSRIANGRCALILRSSRLECGPR